MGLGPASKWLSGSVGDASGATPVSPRSEGRLPAASGAGSSDRVWPQALSASAVKAAALSDERRLAEQEARTLMALSEDDGYRNEFSAGRARSQLPAGPGTPARDAPGGLPRAAVRVPHVDLQHVSQTSYAGWEADV